MPATLPITVGSSDCDPGGFQARGVQAFDIDGILLTWNGETWQALTSPQTRQMQALVSGAGISDASSLTLLTAMANSTRLPAGTLTYTIDAATAWNVSDGIAVFLPASGTVSFAVSGGPTLNGATSTLTRTLAGNAIGYVLLHRIAGAAAYSLSGA